MQSGGACKKGSFHCVLRHVALSLANCVLYMSDEPAAVGLLKFCHLVRLHEHLTCIAMQIQQQFLAHACRVTGMALATFVEKALCFPKLSTRRLGRVGRSAPVTNNVYCKTFHSCFALRCVHAPFCLSRHCVLFWGMKLLGMLCVTRLSVLFNAG